MDIGELSDLEAIEILVELPERKEDPLDLQPIRLDDGRVQPASCAASNPRGEQMR